jgi:hypothetical protein
MASIARRRRARGAARPRRLGLLAAAGIAVAAIALSPRLTQQHAAAPARVVPPPAPAPAAPRPTGDGCGGPSGPVLHVTAAGAGSAWVAPAAGDYRLSEGGVTRVRCGDVLATTGASGTTVRQGLDPGFLGGAAHPVVVDALRAYLAGRPVRTRDGHLVEVARLPAHVGDVRLAAALDGRRFLVVSIDARIDGAAAAREGLFSIDPRAATLTLRERVPGAAPGIPVTAYWLGAQRAVTAVERTARGSASLTVYYEPRAARGATSAVPGVAATFGELQVTSEARSSARASDELRALHTRRWPRTAIRLRGGEQAVVVPYRGALRGRGMAVLTRRSLVSVVGPVAARDAARVARGLRSLPAFSPPARPRQR